MCHAPVETFLALAGEGRERTCRWLPVVGPVTPPGAANDEARFKPRSYSFVDRCSSCRAQSHTASRRPWRRVVRKAHLAIAPLEVPIANVLRPVKATTSNIELTTMPSGGLPCVTNIGSR